MAKTRRTCSQVDQTKMKLWLILNALILGCYAQSCPGCAGQFPFDNYCAADMTIAIDFTTYMQTQQNVLNEVQFVNQKFINFLPISSSYVNTAVLGYGLKGVWASNVFDNYTDVCQQIQASCGNFLQDGLSTYSLENLFKFYSTFLHTFQRPPIPTKFVVFTATNDQDSITAAATYSQQILSANATIIIVGLNQNDPSLLRQLSPLVYDTTFDQLLNDVNLTRFLEQNVCTFDLTTAAPPTTPPPTGDPRSNTIGTECARNASNYWLDLVVVVDHSTSMGDGIANIAASLSAILYDMNFQQPYSSPQNPQYSRIGIILIDDQPTI